MAFGKYYSNYITSVGANHDILEVFRTECGDANATLKKMTLITAVNTTVAINGGAAAHLYLDTDALYKLSFEEKDILVNSIIIGIAGTSVFLAGIY